jgi:hypothetical protein
MKKLIPIIVSILFAFSLTGLCFAADKVPKAEKKAEEKAEEKYEKNAAEKYEKNAAEKYEKLNKIPDAGALPNLCGSPNKPSWCP